MTSLESGERRDHGYMFHGSESFRQQLGQRRASEYAGFFTPYLRPGMRLLDCGCGPGSITLDFAALVAPGEAVGIDLDQAAVAAAQALAGERGTKNARFEVADVYALPFPNESFDAVYAQTLLIHLADPLRALGEMRRVLKPGGLIGLYDGYFGASALEPATPLLDEYRRLALRTNSLTGSPLYAVRQRQLLLQAGFARVEAGGELAVQGTLEETRRRARSTQTTLREAVTPVALAQGWADQATLDAIYDELQRWGESPDSFGFLARCHAVGWV